MSGSELRGKLIDKTAEMLNKVNTVKDLYKCAEIYSILTKETWISALTKVTEENIDLASNGELQPGFGGTNPTD